MVLLHSAHEPELPDTADSLTFYKSQPYQSVDSLEREVVLAEKVKFH